MSIAFPYKCCTCKARFAATAAAERHVVRKHGGMGIIVYSYNELRAKRRKASKQ